MYARPTPVVAIASLAFALLARAEEAPAPRSDGSPAPPDEAVIGVLPFDPTAPAYRVQLDMAKEGSRRLPFMLDTGAQGSVVTPGYARSIGVSVRRMKSTPYRRATSLGRDVQFWVDTSVSDTSSRTGSEYGLLGGNFLEEYVLEIDYPNRVVRFLDPDHYEVPKTTSAPDESVVPLEIKAKRPFADLEINGETRRVLIDTGAFDNVLLSGRAAGTFGIDWKELPNLTKYGTTRGDIEVRLYEADTVRFAGFELGTIPVMVAPRGMYNQAGNTSSVVGYDVLKQFVLRFDYPRRRLWLKRSGNTKPTYMNVDYEVVRGSGAFMFEWGRGMVVIGVRPGSPAKFIGIRPGDMVVNPAGEGPVDAEAFARAVAAGEPVIVARQVNDVLMDVTLPEEKWNSEDD